MHETTQESIQTNQDPRAARPYGGEVVAYICGGAAACLIGIMAILAVLEAHDARPLTPITSNLLTGLFQSLVLITVIVLNTRRATAPVAQQRRQILATLGEVRRGQAEVTDRQEQLFEEMAQLRRLVDHLAQQLIEERPTKEELTKFEEACVQSLHAGGQGRVRQARRSWSGSSS